MEILKLKGSYTITSTNIETGLVQTKTIDNMVMQVFKTRFFEFLNYDVDTPAADNLNLDYLAIGDGSTAATSLDATLENEIFRKTAASKYYTQGSFHFKAVIGPSEGNPVGGFIREIGMFSGGSAAADTGTLFSRTIVNEAKNDSIQLNIEWKLGVN